MKIVYTDTFLKSMEKMFGRKYALLRAVKTVLGVPREIKYFLQRGKRGWADSDVWNLGYYLSDWMPDALRALGKQLHGAPPGLFDHDALGAEQWKWRVIIEKIAISFELFKQMEKNTDDLYGHKDFKKWSKRKQRRLAKKVREENEKLEEKRKEYMNLFVEYLYNLWD